MFESITASRRDVHEIASQNVVSLVEFGEARQRDRGVRIRVLDPKEVVVGERGLD